MCSSPLHVFPALTQPLSGSSVADGSSWTCSRSDAALCKRTAPPESLVQPVVHTDDYNPFSNVMYCIGIGSTGVPGAGAAPIMFLKSSSYAYICNCANMVWHV